MQLTTLVSAAIITLAGILATGATLAVRPVHQATGGGTVDDHGVHDTHAFAARIDGSGNVFGEAEFQLRSLGLTMHVDVACLSVVGNNAWLSGTITTSSDRTRVGQQVLFRVEDNGEGEGATDRTSRIAIGLTVPPCTTTPPLGLVPWTNGNVQVK